MYQCNTYDQALPTWATESPPQGSHQDVDFNTLQGWELLVYIS